MSAVPVCENQPSRSGLVQLGPLHKCPKQTATGLLSVISKSDGLLVTLRDGRCAKDLQQNGTGIATGAVLALGG